MQLTKSERVAELRAYSLLYGLGELASLGKGFILYQNPDNRWSAFLSAGGTEHRATGWDSPATAISALCDEGDTCSPECESEYRTGIREQAADAVRDNFMAALADVVRS